MFKKIISSMLALFICLGILAIFASPVEAASKNPWSVKVNYTQNVVTVYKNGKAVKAMLCSTGSATPKRGTYKMGAKFRWHGLKGGVQGQFCRVITGNIWFHSVPYTKVSQSALKYWEYDKLGTTCSAGCVRLSATDAQYIYNLPAKTPVTFYSSSNPGPLGKPEGLKISDAPAELRAWDPTDPLTCNAWKKNKSYFQYTFNAKAYLKYNPELEYTVGTNELKLKVHYATKGIREKRRASDDFDLGFFMKYYPEIAEQYNNDPYELVKFYNTRGKAAGYIGSVDNPKFKPVFDAFYYAYSNPELRNVFGYDSTKLFWHYEKYGIGEDLNSSPYFNLNSFKADNPELVKQFGSNNFKYYRYFIDVAYPDMVNAAA